MFAFWRKRESLLTVSNEQRAEAIENLVTATTFRHGYYLLLTMSVAIVTLGLLIGNTPIVIGGMVVAPILTPILLLAVALVSRSWRGILHAFTVLLASVAIVLVLATSLTWAVAHATPLQPLVPEQTNALMYLLIAFCSGIVAGFAWVKENLSPTLAGIAIAISLLPPLCNAGIGMALGLYAVTSASLTVFTTNVTGILLAAVLTFVLLGFLPLTNVTQKKVEKEQKATENA